MILKVIAAGALGAGLRRSLAGEPIAMRPGTRDEKAVACAPQRPTVAGLLRVVIVWAALGFGGELSQSREAMLALGVAERETARERSPTQLADQRLQGALEALATKREQTELAEQRQRDTLKAQEEEKKQTELAEQRLYDLRMNLAQRHWEHDSIEQLRQDLVEELPAKQRGIDRRGFEWFYWKRKLFSRPITLKANTDHVLGVAFSPNGTQLASVGRDGTIKVWDAATGRQTRTHRESTEVFMSVAFSPGGKWLASAGIDGTVTVWDARPLDDDPAKAGPSLR
jgi:WD domain, G-beta repeat